MPKTLHGIIFSDEQEDFKNLISFMNCYTQKLNTNKNSTDIHENIDDIAMSLRELKDKQIKQDINIDYEIF